MRKQILLFFLLARPFCGAAQQDWLNTQYMFNLFDINSAYAGNHRTPSIALRHRSQWLGMEGAPSSQYLSYHMPLWKERLGVGAKVLRESIGLREQFMVRGSGAYKVRLAKGRLAFSISTAVISQRARIDKIVARDAVDAVWDNAQMRSTSVSFDAAVFYHTKRWFVGSEWMHLNRGQAQWNANSQSRFYIHGNLLAGWHLPLSEKHLFTITALGRYTEGVQLLGEGNISCLYDNKIQLGAGYRQSNGMIAFAQAQVNPHVRIGYSFDLSTSPLPNAHSGSHEIFLNFTPGKTQFPSIRYF